MPSQSFDTIFSVAAVVKVTQRCAALSNLGGARSTNRQSQSFFVMHRRDVRLFLQLDEPPERKRARRRNTVMPFVPYLKKRWADGCHNAVLLWRELREQGFRGSESTISHYLKNWRDKLTDDAKRKFVADKNCISRVPPSPRQTGWLLTRPDLCKRDWQAEYAKELFDSSDAHRNGKRSN